MNQEETVIPDPVREVENYSKRLSFPLKTLFLSMRSILPSVSRLSAPIDRNARNFQQDLRWAFAASPSLIREQVPLLSRLCPRC